MMKTIARVACAALLVSSAACKKDTKGKADKADKADKMAEKVDKTAPPEEKPKLDTAEDRVAFYRACYAHLNAKELDKMGACLTEDVTMEMLGGHMPALNGRAAVVDHLKQLTTAFPDLEVTPTLILASGNRVASISTVTGTNSGAMTMPGAEMPATNKKVGFDQFHMVEFDPAAGGVAKEWIAFDTATMMGQLGLNPMPHRDVAAKPAGEPTVVIAKDDDAEKANLDAYRKFAMDAFNKHDAKALMAGYTPDAKIADHTAPADMDVKGSAKYMGEMFKAFPDMKSEEVTLFAAGDYVVAHQHVTGTNKGDMPSMKMKKTGKPVDLQVAEVMKFEGGKAKEHHIFFDAMTMATQLGMVPPPGEKKTEETKPAAPAEGDKDKGGTP